MSHDPAFYHNNGSSPKESSRNFSVLYVWGPSDAESAGVLIYATMFGAVLSEVQSLSYSQPSKDES